MSADNEIQILRMEMGMMREREAGLAQRLAALERDASIRLQSQESRLSGENDPDAINAKIRRLQQQTGTVPGDDGSGGGGGGGGGSLGPGWEDQTPAQRLESLRQAVCSILSGLNGASISAECNGDGTITVTLDVPDLPTDLC